MGKNINTRKIAITKDVGTLKTSNISKIRITENK